MDIPVNRALRYFSSSRDSKGEAKTPEKRAPARTWTLPEMDAFVQSFPNDHAADLLRGLYYCSFVQWDDGPQLLKSRPITALSTPDIPKIARELRAIFEAIRIGESDLAMKEHLQTVGLDLASDRKRQAPRSCHRKEITTCEQAALQRQCRSSLPFY